MGTPLVIVLLPFAVLLGGFLVFPKLSGRDAVRELLQEDTPDKRFRGYDLGVIQSQWDRLAAAGLLRTEQRAFQLDLVYACLYSGAFAVSFWIAWSALGRPFNLLWILILALPVFVCLADWAEDLILLGQIKRHPAGLQRDRIRAASIATRLKILFLIILLPVPIVLAVLCVRS
jgi:hypothetical protein